MFVNTGGGGKTQQQPLQNQTNTSVRHNIPYQHSHTQQQLLQQQQQQPHYEHHQGPVTFVTYPFCNVAQASHANTVGNNVGVGGGGQAGHVLYQTAHQPQSQPHPTQQQVGLHTGEQTLHYFAKSAPMPTHHLHHAPQQHSQIRNMIAAVSHQRQPFVVSPNYFALSHTLMPQQTRASLLTNSTPQHTVAAPNGASMPTQLQNPTPRNVAPSGPTSYVSPPYCTPPLLLGAPPTSVTPQPASMLTAATGIGQAQNMQAYAHLSGGIPTAPTSSTPINMQTVGLGSGTVSNTEHNTKQRKHAIPIVNPDTLEIVTFEHLVDASPEQQPLPQSQIKSEFNVKETNLIPTKKVNVESVSIQTEKDKSLTASETVSIQMDNENSINSESVSIKTDNEKSLTSDFNSIQTENDKSLTASIVSNPSDIILTRHSQSISAKDTDNTDHQMKNEANNYAIDRRMSGSALALSTPAVFIAPDANTTTHSGSESLKMRFYEDPNDTDADTNEQELDHEESLAMAGQPTLFATCIVEQMSDDLSKQHSNNISAIDLLAEQARESDSDHSSETEIKSKDEPCITSVNVEVKCKEVKKDLQPSVSTSIVLNESKRGRKNRKLKRKEKNQKKLKQQQNNKSSNLITASSPIEGNTATNTANLKTTGTDNKIPDLKSKVKINETKEEPKLTLIRYSLEELKAFSKSPESRKTPVVPCQKGDCISQLFVARQQHHHHNLAAISLQHHVQQSYHQMNFNESLEFVTGKRRVGVSGGATTRKHEITNNAMSTTNINGGDNTSQIQKKMQVIRINLSLNEEIKLSKCENAWQPKFVFNNSNNNMAATKTEKYDDDDIEDVLKKVRGILNKLTSENFDVLLKEMTGIKINSQEKMQRVMLLIFEKTVSEPNFAPTYAKFSKVLFEEVRTESKKVFNSLLIKRLQMEFESNVNNADAKERKLQQIIEKIDETTDSQKKIELQAELEHQEYQFRRRAWGTVRFIGEMYKLHSLSADRVLLCVESLLDIGSEEKLEYMCKLLTTVGHLLENSDVQSFNNNIRINKIFAKIQTIVKEAREPSNKKTKICSRVRFLMQDLIELRSRNWGQTPNTAQIPLRRRLPEDKNSNLPSGSLNTYERGSSQRMSFGNNNRQNQIRSKEVGGGNYFMQKAQKTPYLNQREHTIDPKKLNFSRGDESSQATTKLGNSSIYVWPNVSDRQAQQSGRTTTLSSSFKTSHQQKQPRQQPQQTQSQYWNAKHLNSSSDSDIKAILDSCSRKDNQILLNHLTEEYLDCLSSRSKRWQEEVFSTWQKASLKQQICLVYYILMDYLHLTGVKLLERNACASIFIYLMTYDTSSKTTFTRAYEQFAEEFPDLLMDVPNGCISLFQFVGPLLHERLITFSDIWHTNWQKDQQFTERFVNAFVSYFTKEFGANYMQDLWHKQFQLDRGQLFISDPQRWRQFVAANKLQFLYDSKIKPEIVNTCANKNDSTVVEQHVQRLEVLLSSPNDSNLALDYINTNVNINSCFLKKLTRFLCCDYATTKIAMTGSSRASSATTSKNSSTCSNTSSSSSAKNMDLPNNINNTKNAQLNINAFRKNCVPILRLCLDANEDNELICLDTIVDDIQQQYETNTANEFICGIVDVLYDCEVIAKESLEKWYKQRKHSQKRNLINSKNQLQRTLSAQLEAYMQKLL